MWPEQSQSKCGQPCSTPYERIDSTSTATIALNVENNMHISNAHKAAKLHCLHLERQPRIRRINNNCTQKSRNDEYYGLACSSTQGLCSRC